MERLWGLIEALQNVAKHYGTLRSVVGCCGSITGCHGAFWNITVHCKTSRKHCRSLGKISNLPIS